MGKFKKPLIFTLILLPISIIAGIFVSIYQVDIYPQDMMNEIVSQLGSIDVLMLITAIQTVIYALFCGFFGYILSDKLGLLKPFKLEKKQTIVTIIFSLIGGIIFSLDYWTFGNIIDGIKESTEQILNFNAIMASVLYGGIIEEIMLRLFFMSLLAFVIWKLFYKKYNKVSIPSSVFILANIISALLFALGHLPATVVVFGELTILLVVRCVLLNGGFGLLFGHLYKKYGIVYSILCHMLLHIVSKSIWAIFI